MASQTSVFRRNMGSAEVRDSRSRSTFAVSNSGMFIADREAASEQGKKGGATQPDEVYKPSEHGGLTKSGEPDKRMSSEVRTTSHRANKASC